MPSNLPRKEKDLSRYAQCKRCEAYKRKERFYSLDRPDLLIDHICTDCVASGIDPDVPESYEWIFEELDRPCIQPMIKSYFDRDAKGSTGWLGKYMRTMHCTGYSPYGYADSEMLTNEYNITHRPEQTRDGDEEFNNKLRDRLAAGEITAAQYDLLARNNRVYANEPEPEPEPEPPVEEKKPEKKKNRGRPKKKKKGEPEEEEPQPVVEEPVKVGRVGLSKAFNNDLSSEDVKYLNRKWGEDFTETEQIQMEDMYNRYANEFDLNVDREITLRMMCKTQLRMESALSANNIADYQKLSAVLKDMRTSAKFTEAQKIVEVTRPVDSIGEIVDRCERLGGLIPAYNDPDEFPQDKIDFAIRDMKEYTHNLIMSERGLASIIETYVHRLEAAEEEEKMHSQIEAAVEQQWDEYLNNGGIEEEIDKVVSENVVE